MAYLEPGILYIYGWRDVLVAMLAKSSSWNFRLGILSITVYVFIVAGWVVTCSVAAGDTAAPQPRHFVWLEHFPA